MERDAARGRAHAVRMITSLAGLFSAWDECKAASVYVESGEGQVWGYFCRLGT